MKKLILSFICLACVAMLLSCGNKGTNSKSGAQTNTEQPAKTVKVNSPVGTYSATEDGKPMQFVLNADGTGYENYQGTDKRPFTWKAKDGGVVFTYNGQTGEFNLPIDIEKGQITYGSLVYKKE